jgi:hypothetical protein
MIGERVFSAKIGNLFVRPETPKPAERGTSKQIEAHIPEHSPAPATLEAQSSDASRWPGLPHARRRIFRRTFFVRVLGGQNTSQFVALLRLVEASATFGYTICV